MGYTIKLHGSQADAERVKTALIACLKNDNRFTADLRDIKYIHKGPRVGSRKEGYGFEVKRVRLTTKKPYCGQHAGECVINPFRGPEKKKISSLLEFQDWVDFHNVVNDFLDATFPDADVWSRLKGTMWMRKGTKRRVRYDYEEKPTNHWQPLREWNLGDESQFV